MSEKVTGRPWRVVEIPKGSLGGRYVVVSPGYEGFKDRAGWALPATVYDSHQELAEEHAALIVRSVNNAEGLAIALRAMLNVAESGKDDDWVATGAARAALAEWDKA